jgi:hypothetical protein
MKAFLILLVLFALSSFFVSCGKAPEGPDPKPPEKGMSFTAGNANIQIKGVVIEGSKVSPEEARSVVRFAIDMLEAQ